MHVNRIFAIDKIADMRQSERTNKEAAMNKNILALLKAEHDKLEAGGNAMTRQEAADAADRAADALRAASGRAALALWEHGRTPEVVALHQAEAEAREALMMAEIAHIRALWITP